MDAEKFDRLLQQANIRLGNANIKVAIERANHRLYLRATFPPKPDSGKSSPWQQRLSIAQANPDGLRLAESTAKTIGGQLDLGTFEWSAYLDSPAAVGRERTIGDAIAEFEREYFATRQRTGATLTTWQGDYLAPFNRLPGDRPLTEEILREAIDTTTPDTRQRRRFVLAYSQLAEFAGIDHGLRRFIGNYSSSLNPRDLPDDRAIALTIDRFTDPLWRWAYAMMACYGLRNHEIFLTDLTDYPIAYVSRGKSKERYIWPLYPEWADLWGVREGRPPECSGSCNSDLGHRVTVAFSRAGVSFSPYNLRHAWAVRSLEFGLDLVLAAAQMGHSVKVHTDVYHKWITKQTHERAMKILLERGDRPLPP